MCEVLIEEKLIVVLLVGYWFVDLGWLLMFVDFVDEMMIVYLSMLWLSFVD